MKLALYTQDACVVTFVQWQNEIFLLTAGQAFEYNNNKRKKLKKKNQLIPTLNPPTKSLFSAHRLH